MDNIELKRFWESIKEDLLQTLPESVHPWVHSLQISGYDKGTLTVVTGQAMAKELLKKYHYTQLNDSLRKFSTDSEVNFNIIYDETSAKLIQKETEKINKKEAELQLKEKAMENLSYMQSASNLNLKYKFENFVVGENNKFAHDAAMAVAKNPATKYNPLFIYGAAGLGKTHLMQAIGHYILFNNTNKMKVKYTKTDDYVNDFISNSRKSNDAIENMSKFYKKYTNIDIILIDDIQFIEGKKRSMEKMQHTFDTLYNKGKQIVITSDRLPKEIPSLTSALCSRFEMGLMVELTPPEFITRFKILKKLAEQTDIEFDEEALKYIAKNFENNVRELEGAFTRVMAYAEISNEKLTLNFAKKILKCDDTHSTVTISDIIKVTASYFNISVSDIMGSARGQKIAKARHIAIYLSRELTNSSFMNIADKFGKKHTTIMFAHEKIQKDINTDKDISIAIREIKQGLKLL